MGQDRKLRTTFGVIAMNSTLTNDYLERRRRPDRVPERLGAGGINSDAATEKKPSEIAGLFVMGALATKKDLELIRPGGKSETRLALNLFKIGLTPPRRKPLQLKRRKIFDGRR